MSSLLSLVPLPVLLVPSPPFPTVLPLLGSPVITRFNLHQYTELPGGIRVTFPPITCNKAWPGLSYPPSPATHTHLHLCSPSPACNFIATALPESAKVTANRTEQSLGDCQPN